MSRQQMLDDWVAKARVAQQCNDEQQLWPSWSLGELLAVATILDDAQMLDALNHTRDEALEQLRHEIGAPTAGAALDVFLALRKQVAG